MAEITEMDKTEKEEIKVVKRSKKKIFLALLLVPIILFSALLTYRYFVPRQDAVLKVSTTDFPGVTLYDTPEKITIYFKNTANRNNKHYREQMNAPIAPLDKVTKEVNAGVTLKPALSGKWNWENDNTLVFTPKQDWPADQDFIVELTQKLFSKKALHFKNLNISYTTPYFQASIDNMSLEQDIAGGKDHNVFSTLNFTHPVDKGSLAKSLKLRDGKKEIPFELSYEKNLKTAYVRSNIVNIDSKERYIKLSIDGTLKTSLGNALVHELQEKKILIPDIYSFLKIASVNYSIVNDKDGNPEQIYHISLTDSVTRKEFIKYFHFQLKLAYGEKSKPEYLKPKLLENEKDSSKDYFIKSQIDARGEVEIRLKKGMKSINGYELRRQLTEQRRIPSYPTELKIMGEGSLLALSGEKKLSFATRGITGLKVSIQKLQGDQINHLISQTYGDITSPSFRSYEFSAENITDKEMEKTISLASVHPKDRNYASIDLSKYLEKQGSGIFFIKVRDWNIKNNRSEHYLEDKRMVVVTDMGLVVKKASDGKRDVFIESIVKGKAISGAKISVLGKNGQVISHTYSSAKGKASFYNLDSFKKAQAPTVIIAKKGNDLSFIPYNGYSRNINFSKFDVGGIRSYNTNTDTELTAFAFNDRGIYRPGETVHLAAIVRQGNFDLSKGTVVRAKVVNSRNKLIHKKDYTLASNGFFELDIETDMSSATGSYNFSVYLPHKNSSGYEREDYLGGTKFSVEEFQPDTMKIKTVFIPGFKAGWLSMKALKAEVKLSNLFGLAAQNRTIKASATLTPTQFSFSKYADYHFRAPLLDTKVRRQEHLVFDDSKTDKEGLASFDITLAYDKGGFRIDFKAEGFEPDGGRSVNAKSTTLISDAAYMLGIKADGGLNYLKKDQDRSLELIVVDSDLKKIALKDVKIELIYNKRLSVLTKQRDGRYQYESVIKKETWQTKHLNLGKKGLKYKLNTSSGGDFTLNISDKNAKLLSSTSYHVAASGNMTGALEKNAELSVKLNKKTYKPGEEIEMNIIAPYIGTGLITIESDKVHAHKWFKTKTSSSIQSIRLPKGLEGNAYINVSFVRSINSNEIFTSPLSYSVQAFNINSDKRKIKVSLDSAKLIKPGDRLTIKYKTDRKAKIVVYAINEGILQVAKYRLPEPSKHFLKKRALDVQTFQILDLILPEFSKYVQAAGIGGGMMDAMESKARGANLNPFQRTLDQPAVYWSGIIDADTNEKELYFDIPDTFNGSLKVMAVAVSDEAMGSSFTKTTVRGPFVLSPNVLTVAAPNDTFEVTVGVSNSIKGSGKDVLVDISIELSKNLELLSQRKLGKKISEGDEDKVTFKLRAKDSLGEGTVTFTAQYGKKFQKRSATLSIRPAQSFTTTLKVDYKKDIGVIKVDRTLYKELASKSLSASNSPFVLATGMTDYLSTYPHGCTEQIISQTFPWIALSSSTAFEHKKNQATQNAQGVISMLQTRQLGDGGFALWPGSSYVNTFASVYALHFITELKDSSLNVDVPTALYAGGMDYLRKIAREHTSSMEDSRRRAMAIYLLIRNKEVATNYLVDLHDSLKNLDSWKKDITSTYIAASYKLLKKDKTAQGLVEGFDPSYESGYTDFQSNLTMNAQYIYLVSKHFPGLNLNVKENIMPLLKPVIAGKLNTISASYTIMALSAFSALNEAKYGKDDLEFFIVAKQKVALPKTQIKPFMKAKVPLSTPEVTIESKSPLFYQLVQSGYDKKPHTKALSEGIEIFKEYLDKNGSIVTEVNQGDELEVLIKVRSTKKSSISNMVLIDLLPGGFEVIRESVPRNIGSWRADYVDIREDRVVFYASFSSSITELRYKVKATAAGTFIIPSASASSMYDPDLRSHTAASSMKVNPAN